MKWKLMAAGLSIGLALVALVVAAESFRAAHTVRYRAALERLTSIVVRLNDPIALAFASGAVPRAVDVAAARETLRAVRAELESLGPPPGALAEAHAALTEAVGFYQQAFDQLDENLAAGSNAPFSQDFRTLAAHGGEQIHRAAQSLFGEEVPND